MSDDRLVYSTESGRICPACTRPAAQCTCRKRPAKETAPRPFPADGTVRIRRETQGRKGKTVTVIHGLSLTVDALEELARALKQHCGSGGTIQKETIVIQGDHRQRIRELLEKKGYSVKLAGG
ncbi:MAG: stress response translation initiation inhibitor YciH [Desulfobacterales bacterium]|nr:stress response translation initiation inhibitor YciH [Desulfobacterales bacterium]